MSAFDTPAFARAALALSLIAGLAAALPAAAQQRAPTGGGVGSVVHCDAAGRKQEGGAVIGAILGAVAGSNLAKNDRGTGTAIGAVGGAAAGSWVGCKMQRDEAAKRVGGVYSVNGRKLASNIDPAHFEKTSGRFVARTNVNLRAGPSTGSAKVGALSAGQNFDAMAKVARSDWILVGRDGVGVGYVKGGYVAPAEDRYASRW
jgi:hypothetical protein